MKIIAPLAVALALTGGSAMAQDAGWYVRGEAGASSSGQIDADTPVDLDSGWVVGGAGGYGFGNGVRVEGEMLYMGNDIDDASEGDTSMFAAFANVAYEFDNIGPVRPFVGGGVGFGQVSFDNGLVDDDDTGFAYQAKAGVAYDINERMTAELAYRYVVVTDVEFDTIPGSPMSGDYDNQAVTVGLRYKLGQ